LNLERLECFLKQAPREYRWAIEFRDSRWLVDDVYALLRAYNAALVIHDHEDIPSLHPQVCVSFSTLVENLFLDSTFRICFSHEYPV
jgi:hypothetical protein